eukprot:749225-Rhodomonas_salina.1
MKVRGSTRKKEEKTCHPTECPRPTATKSFQSEAPHATLMTSCALADNQRHVNTGIARARRGKSRAYATSLGEVKQRIALPLSRSQTRAVPATASILIEYLQLC